MIIYLAGAISVKGREEELSKDTDHGID